VHAQVRSKKFQTEQVLDDAVPARFRAPNRGENNYRKKYCPGTVKEAFRVRGASDRRNLTQNNFGAVTVCERRHRLRESWLLALSRKKSRLTEMRFFIRVRHG